MNNGETRCENGENTEDTELEWIITGPIAKKSEKRMLRYTGWRGAE